MPSAETDAGLLAELRALAAKWDSQEYLPGAFYPEASAYAQGRDAQAESCADDLRDLLDTRVIPPDTTDN